MFEEKNQWLDILSLNTTLWGQRGQNKIFWVLFGGNWSATPYEIHYKQNKNMSIYSGFHSRKLEEKYNNLVVETLEVLTKIVINCLGKIKI